MRRLTTDREDDWRAFVEDHADARIQHTLGFRDAVDRTFRNAESWYHLVGEDDVRAVFPFFRMNSWLFGTEIVSQPLMDNGGFLGDVRQEDIEDLVDHIGDTPAEVRLNTFMDSYEHLEGLLLDAGFEKHVLRQQFIKELYAPDEMYADLSDSTTRMVEEAEDAGLEIEDIGTQDDREAFYAIYRSAMKHFGTPQPPLSYFEALWDELYPGRVKGMNCVYEGEVIASMICLTVSDCCYFIYNVSEPDHLDKRPNDLLYWRMMEWAHENGYRYFDFGQVQADAEDGSHAAGLYHFKDKWDPELYDKPVFTLNKTVEDTDHERARDIWRDLPDLVTDIAGPFLASRKGY